MGTSLLWGCREASYTNWRCSKGEYGGELWNDLRMKALLARRLWCGCPTRRKSLKTLDTVMALVLVADVVLAGVVLAGVVLACVVVAGVIVAGVTVAGVMVAGVARLVSLWLQ